MELRQLKYFVAIVDHASISKAATKLYIAQSALSLQISQLEDELGERLFNRSRTGVKLTSRGEVFLRHARTILQQVQDARLSVRTGSAEPAGEVAIAIPQSVSSALALALIRTCLQRLPLVRLRLTEELSGHIAGRLNRGEVALAVMFEDDHGGAFESVDLARERLSVIGAPAVLCAGDAPMTLAEVLSLPLILPTEGHGVRAQIDRLARQTGFPALEVVAEITSVSVLKSMLLAQMGVTIQARMALMEPIERGELVARPISDPFVSRTISLCRVRNQPASEAAQAVWELLVELVQRLCADGQWPDAQAFDEAQA
jgi:LysR family nitrogen assimilation transcriptional regulator